jgi:phosphatidylglycerol:prolipoprotein diacylglycerol transferase
VQAFTTALSQLDPIAFSLGPVAVRWYGLGYLAGFLGAFLLMYYFAKRWGLELSGDDYTTIMLGVILGVFLGGRLGYCLFYEPGYFLRNPIEIIAFWHGGLSGMSFHGGFIGILIGGYIACRSVGLAPGYLANLGTIGAPIGFFFVRLANFVNGELWGRVTTAPWGVVFAGAGPLPRHPSQIYEALLEGLVLLVVMVALAYKRPPLPPWQMFGIMTLLYGVFRIAVEFFRQPDVQLGFIAGGWLTMGMLLSLPMVIGGALIIWWSTKHA